MTLTPQYDLWPKHTKDMHGNFYLGAYNDVDYIFHVIGNTQPSALCKVALTGLKVYFGEYIYLTSFDEVDVRRKFIPANHLSLEEIVFNLSKQIEPKIE